jgi:uncharacterized iron-regulated membrane protein
MRVGRLIFKLHTWLGVVAGVPLLAVCCSGALLVFSRQLDTWLNPDLLSVSAQVSRLSFDEMLSRVRRTLPQSEILSFRRLPERADDVITMLGRMNGQTCYIHVDPYTGAVLGVRPMSRPLVDQLWRFHRSLFLGAGGSLLLAVSAMALIGSLLTGLLIYPRTLLKMFTMGVRWRRGSRLALADLHRLIGVITLIFNLLLALTGLYLTWPALTSHLSHHMARPERVAAAPEGVGYSIDSCLANVQELLPGFRLTGFTLPAGQNQQLIVYGKTPGNPLLGEFSSHVSFNASTGAVERVHDASLDAGSVQLGQMMAPLHYGNYGGLIARVLYFLGGMTPGLLAVTGFIIWRLRLRNGKRWRAVAAQAARVA